MDEAAFRAEECLYGLRGNIQAMKRVLKAMEDLIAQARDNGNPSKNFRPLTIYDHTVASGNVVEMVDRGADGCQCSKLDLVQFLSVRLQMNQTEAELKVLNDNFYVKLNFPFD